MNNILSPSNIEVLAQMAWSKVLLAFDYDGTLAPIVDEPGDAFMRPSTRELFFLVAKKYPCIVISGRAQADVLKRLRGIPVREIIGNHGIEPWRYSGPLPEKVQGWIPHLEKKLRSLQGVVIEDKVFSLAIHYRKSREKKRVRREIFEAILGWPDARIIGGKDVFNLLPLGSPHKGTALLAARDRLGCDTALYVGDDETDEDVFGLDEPGRLLSIRIEESTQSQASYFLSDQPKMDELLALLLGYREPTSETRQEGPRARRAG